MRSSPKGVNMASGEFSHLFIDGQIGTCTCTAGDAVMYTAVQWSGVGFFAHRQLELTGEAVSLITVDNSAMYAGA
jgi:hypothetical protein